MRWFASLRWQLTLTFCLLLAILLGAAGWVEDVALRQTLLQSRIQSVETSYFSVIASVRQQEAAEARAGLGRLSLADGARLLATEVAAERVGIVLYTRRLDPLTAGVPHGEVAADLPRIDRAILRAAAAGHPSGPMVVASRAGDQLAVVVPISRRTRAVPLIGQLSVSAAQVENELAAIRTLLVVGGLALVGAALLVGLYLGTRALRPLGRLTAAARALAEGDLTQRSRLRPRRDEVGVLARVFDDMAASVERTVRVRAEAEQRMRQFVADASHELRTPLTTIKGYVDVLQRGASRDPKALAEALPAMARETERMRGMVQDLLTLARAEASRPPQPRPVALAALVREVLRGGPGADPVNGDLDPEVLALADPEALQTILRNLRSNAERHAPGAPVRWRTLRAAGRVGVSCRDEGPGIDLADQPHIFERFFRADRTRARRDSGSGLGLAIVHALVTAQGGTVTVESAPGQGTTFSVWLPAADPPRPPSAAVRPATALGARGGRSRPGTGPPP
ncbi:MAG TPA: HAMP domain-containing sensor histidine kinase [Candidatus Micrarchaeia archaeon]|nr:HAMP domain-containing sensor histidine kinase [Candidatus Micrarchaeia archaeon]